MLFNIYSYTNKGARSYNEDCGGYWQDFQQDRNNSRGVYVLADGLGGHGYGEVASRFTVEYILGVAGQRFPAGEADLLSLMNNVNTAIMHKQNADPKYKQMRTTVAAGFFSENLFSYFNVGDSRVYYFKNGCLYMQTKDHSVSQMSVNLGEIRQEDIRFHDDRSKLLKVLGDVPSLNINKLDPPIPTESGDAFLLCSDGFWEYIYETEMELDLVKSSSPKEWCEFMCKRLLHRVYDGNINNDNFTVICGIATGSAEL